MRLALTPEEEAFRARVHTFIEENLPADIRARVEGGQKLRRDDFVRWQKILYEQGFIAPHWPKEYGGSGWTPVERYLFED